LQIKQIILTGNSTIPGFIALSLIRKQKLSWNVYFCPPVIAEL